MASNTIVVWRGDNVRRRVVQATREAFDETMALCVVTAKSNTPVKTAALQGSIRLNPAQLVRGNVVEGVWGSFEINYALAVEVGTRGGSVQVSAHTRAGKSGTHNVRAHWRLTQPRPGRNMLRGAADEHYPDVRARIAKRLRTIS